MLFKKILFCAIRVTVSSKPGIQHITPEMKGSVCGDILALFLSVVLCRGSHINCCICCALSWVSY